MQLKPSLSLVSGLLITALSSPAFCQQSTALDQVKKVADLVIRDTRFELAPVVQKTELGIQVVRYNDLPLRPGESGYARSVITVATDTTIDFGLNSGGDIKIWLDGKLIFSQNGQPAPPPEEIAYNSFHFQDRFTTALKKGAHDLLVRFGVNRSASTPAIYIWPTAGHGYQNTAVQFSNPVAALAAASSWLLLGPVRASASGALPEQRISSYHIIDGTPFNWFAPAPQLLSELVVSTNAVYKRDAYADWHYANGITLWSMLALSDVSGDERYISHVKNYFRFAIRHKDYFQWQFRWLSAFRGSYHKLFRLSMLDDSGAPGLPLAELNTREKDTAFLSLLMPITDYVVNRQVRLADGTFCRPEPIDSTVWADDLFMSTPFLLRIAKLTGDKKYYDDAATQILHFHRYLYDESAGLYYHGYFKQGNKPSVAHWGRANGWIVWATAEVLNGLPANHPAYKKILSIFRQQMAGLIKYQNSNGFWRQLPDRQNSYEETSCTAMFTLALARGVRKGWLPASYKKAALSGWNAVSGKIDADGAVHGICRGTEIGYTEQYYFDRPVVDHDPRGLGAVITAGIEIAQLK